MYRKSCRGNLLTSDLTLGTLLQGRRVAKRKSAYDLLIIVLQCWDVKLAYRKTWAETSDVVMFDSGPSFKFNRG